MSANDDDILAAGPPRVPNDLPLVALMERTGYQLVQANGQRKYGGPPPEWSGSPPPRGCEIFVGKIPRDCYEDELVPVFEAVGIIYELRLMMDFSGTNRGYAFVMYTNKNDAQAAVRELNNYEIRKGRLLGVCRSVDNCRLFVGGIPKTKNKAEILAEVKKVTENVVDVIVYPSATDKTKNRGFAFVEYESHRAAAVARRKLIPGKLQLWGHQIAVDWAEPEIEVDEEVMLRVKILYIRNLMLSTTEDHIRQAFCKVIGKENVIERVKKIRDYAFIHFIDREDACKAMHLMNGTSFDGAVVEVVLAKPADKSDNWRTAGRPRGSTRGSGPAGREETFSTAGTAAQPLTYDGATMLNAFYANGGVYASAMAHRSQSVPLPRGTPHAGRPASRGGDRSSRRNVSGRQLSAAEMLDDICRSNRWQLPIYQFHTTVCRSSGADSDVQQLFFSKVALPSLAHTIPGGVFMPNRLCRTLEEAKYSAAEFVLMSLGYQTNGVELSMLPPPPLAMYHGHPMLTAAAAPYSGATMTAEHGYAYIPLSAPQPPPPLQGMVAPTVPLVATGTPAAGAGPRGVAMPGGEITYDPSQAVYSLPPAQYQQYS